MKFRRALYLSLLCQGCFFGEVMAQVLPEPPTVSVQELKLLTENLKKGGYVIFFRHLDTRQDQEDRQPVHLNDCKAQRNLSDEGRTRGKMIGRVFKQASIPVGEVTSSPFCRTQETARLIAGRTVTDADLFFAIALNDQGKKQKEAALRKLFVQQPTKGKNTVIVSHTANLQEAIGLWPKPEGVAYVLKPDGNSGVSAVDRMTPDTWAGLIN
jgi:phosphohistidine phosphatase SixA